MPTNLDDNSFKGSGMKLRRYRLVRFASSLVAKNIVQNSNKSNQKFRLVAYSFCATKKITSSIAGFINFQYDEFPNTVFRKYYQQFVSFDFQKDRIDTFLEKYISARKELRRICKLIFIFFHGQSFVERGFSVNRELIHTNMNEKYCVKSVPIQSFSGFHFAAFGLNVERCSVSLHIQPECGIMRTRIIPNTDTCQAVKSLISQRLDLGVMI